MTCKICDSTTLTTHCHYCGAYNLPSGPVNVRGIAIGRAKNARLDIQFELARVVRNEQVKIARVNR